MRSSWENSCTDDMTWYGLWRAAIARGLFWITLASRDSQGLENTYKATLGGGSGWEGGDEHNYETKKLG